MKTAISLPGSKPYTELLKAYLRRHNREQILAKLNKVYSKESSELDPAMAKMQFMSLHMRLGSVCSRLYWSANL